MYGLIESPRLRPGDLDVWRRLAMADRLYAQRHQLRLERLAAEARHTIHQFLSSGPAYCSISWGKDSVVIADLCRGMEIPLCFVRVDPVENPDSLMVRDAFAPDNLHEIRTEWAWNGQHWKPVTPYGGFKKAAALLGPRRITGIRKAESFERRLRGSHSTQNSCVPISKWSTQDVFAYLQLRQLPIHPAYAMSNNGQFAREYLRVDAIGESSGSARRREWENLYYPDILWKSSTSAS